MKGLQIVVTGAFLFISASSLVAQSPEIDSLERAYNMAIGDSVKFNALKALCFKLPGTDSAKTEHYCSLLIKQVDDVTDPVERADAYAAIGNYYNSTLNFRESLSYFRKSIELFRRAGGHKAEIAYAKCLADYAYVFHINGDFDTALTYDLEAERILEKYDEYDYRLGLYNRISDIYARLNQPQKSEVYDMKLAAISNKLTSPKMKAFYCIAATYSLDPKKDFAKVDRLLREGMLIGKKNSLLEIVWTASNALGDCYASVSNYPAALAWYDTALVYARRLSLKYDEVITKEGIGGVYMMQKKYGEAAGQFGQALDIARQINASALQKELYGSLSSLEIARGNYRKAYNFLSAREDVIFRIFDEEDQRQINFLNAKYESEKKAAEIKRLTDQEQLQKLAIEKHQALVYLFSAFSLVMLIALFFIVRFYQNKKKLVEQGNELQRQKIKELEKEKQITAVRYALQGEETERARLARDLHDGLGGLLSGAKMAFSSFRETFVHDERQLETFRHALDLLGKSITELQRVAHNMMPQALVNGTIREAVSEFCERLDNGALAVKFQFFGNEEKIGQSYQIAIYRIVQELVNNVIKHSGASEALVQLVQDKDRVSVAVQDNGAGFDPSAALASNGSGLKNLRMRVESLGGRFDIDSGVGRGTEISVSFENMENQQ